ncbi:hypothetical protein DY023_07965 [Microbacterium bovistercoris]|uniref:Tetratricopeptide repeat protein n=1 Tax=Microbacterium bovistercoris TaxID=2293570 RepID=A0A371NUC7_9MICO|nr:hypothetical protein [Microbacterium bovistercoris]REJ05875.1 hypothetical protein DY023_07965 [Microbacterium bovistercoris]
MPRPAQRLEQLLEEIDRTPWGPAEQALTAEAVALAVEIGDEQLEYRARMRQTASANMGGATDVMLNSFAWCLARHDADPVRFPADIENGGADLMWQFKWMAASLRSSPSFSQEQIAAVLDDMEAHYRAAGIGMSGVLTARFEDAWDAGRMDEAEELRVRLEATPRDDYSHCDACGRSQIAGFFAATDREEEAVRLVEEMVEGGFSCGEEPEHALSRALIPYLHLGRFEEAKAAHLRSYRLAKDNPDNLVIVANNIEFAALTGNEARALTMIERHLPWLAHDQLNVDGHHAALSTIAFALDRVTAAGHGDTPVRGADAAALVPLFGEHDGTWTAEQLAAAAWTAADRIGAAFDERDGTDGHAQRRARMQALAAEHYDVPIRSDAFAPAPAAATPVDADGWYDRAVAIGSYGSELDALAAADRAESAGLSDPARRARMLGLRIGALVSLEQVDEASALLAPRVAELRASAQEDQAELEERLGLSLFGRGTPDDIAALEREWADAAALPERPRGDLALTLASARAGAGDPAAVELAAQAQRIYQGVDEDRLATTSVLTAAVALLRTERTAEAAELLDQLVEGERVNDGHRARALDLRARVRGGIGEFGAGAADADRAAGLLAGLGAERALANAQLLAGALWEDAGSPEQAVVRYRLAARLVAQHGGDREGVEFRQAKAMLAAGDAAEAAELLSDVLQREEAAETPAGSRAITVGMLARALAGSGEFGQAVGAFGYQAGLHAEAEEPADQAMAMLEQARILARFGEMDEAIETLEEAADVVRPTEAAGAITQVLHELGQGYGSQKDERAFALFDEVARIAAENDAAWLIADVTDSRGRAFAEFGRIDDAVAAALTAADAFAELGDAGSAGGSELFAARVLTEAGRRDDAVPLFRSAIDRAAEIPPLRQVAALELGDVLSALGRNAEAAEARAIAEG